MTIPVIDAAERYTLMYVQTEQDGIPRRLIWLMTDSYLKQIAFPSGPGVEIFGYKYTAYNAMFAIANFLPARLYRKDFSIQVDDNVIANFTYSID